jgi:FolB domain-containing protein
VDTIQRAELDDRDDREDRRLGRVFISDLKVQGILGVNDWERTTPREIVINLEIVTDVTRAGGSDDIADCIDYQKVAEKVSAHAARIERFTVEALATDLARIVLAEPRVDRVRVRVEKPGAVQSCRSVGVEVELP